MDNDDTRQSLIDELEIASYIFFIRYNIINVSSTKYNCLKIW